MKIIEIKAHDNGAHRNQTGTFATIPDGWAVIPSTMAVPDTFPFVDIEVDGQTVTAMTANQEAYEAAMAAAEEVEPEPTTEEVLNAMLGVSE